MHSIKHHIALMLLTSLGVLWGGASFQAASAQEPPIPADIHISLLAKVLAYDRSLQSQNDEPIVLGIVQQGTWKGSLDIAKEVKQVIAANQLKIGKRPIRVVALNVTSAADFESHLENQQINVLYIAPLPSPLLHDILPLSRTRQLRTITGVAEYVDAGVAVGIGEKDYRPLILVNLPAARLEGADLSAQVLQLAKVLP